jgi:hypothetical protein
MIGEGFRALELRREVQCHLAGALVVDGGPARQQQCGQHVVGAARAADDEIADGLGPVAMPALHDGLEHRERAPAERIELDARTAVLFQRACQMVAPLARTAAEPRCVIEALRDHPVQHARVLSDIEARQVKSESVDAPQQPLDIKEARVRSLVRFQAHRDERDVVAELARVLVGAGAPLVGTAQPLADLREEHPIGHAVMAHRGDGTRARQQPHVLLDPLAQLARGCHAARAL